MKEWLFSIVGVVFLAILFDLIYPSGRTNKFCKSLFGIIAAFIMISPIIKLESIDFSEDYTDDVLVNNINKSKETVYKLQMEDYLKRKGYAGVTIEIAGNVSNNVFEIENVYIDITNIVLTEEMENINIYEVIVNEISNEYEIDSKRIFVYG